MKISNTKGFTLIELLIVIAVLGILIVAILSAIDPLEQIRKARDAGRKSDAAELLSAYERYYATFQCYPWDTGAPDCSNITTPSRNTGPVWPNFGSTAAVTGDSELIAQGEVKPQYTNRNSITNSEIWVSENSDRQTTTCFEPESKSGRTGGYGRLQASATGGSTAGVNCGATYLGGGDTTGLCWVCLPQ